MAADEPIADETPSVDRTPDDLAAARSPLIGQSGNDRSSERAANRVRRWWRSQQHDDRSEALRDRGGRPSGSLTVGVGTDLVYEHLQTVLARFDNVNGVKLCREWKRNVKGSAGVMLRNLMGKQVGEAPPALRTLQRALKDLRQ